MIGRLKPTGEAQDSNSQDEPYDGRSENLKTNGMKRLERPN